MQAHSCESQETVLEDSDEESQNAKSLAVVELKQKKVELEQKLAVVVLDVVELRQKKVELEQKLEQKQEPSREESLARQKSQMFQEGSGSDRPRGSVKRPFKEWSEVVQDTE